MKRAPRVQLLFPVGSMPVSEAPTLPGALSIRTRTQIPSGFKPVTHISWRYCNPCYCSSLNHIRGGFPSVPILRSCTVHRVMCILILVTGSSQQGSDRNSQVNPLGVFTVCMSDLDFQCPSITIVFRYYAKYSVPHFSLCLTWSLLFYHPDSSLGQRA